MASHKQTTPYVISIKKREEYLFILFFFITISFGLGYAFGYLHGTPIKETEKTIANKLITPLSTKSKSPSDQSEKSEDKSPNSSLAKIKEQQPNNQHVKTIKTDASPVQTTKAIKPKPPAPISKKRVTPQKIDKKSETTVVKSAPQIKIYKTKNTVTTKPVKKVKESVESTNKNPTQYLVQVGLFASRENASSFIDQLEESGFEGYFEGFISTSGVEKYNVRLGPFTEKSTAQKKMSEFKKTHNSSAYILTHK